jgi:hypothetical protein
MKNNQLLWSVISFIFLAILIYITSPLVARVSRTEIGLQNHEIRLAVIEDRYENIEKQLDKILEKLDK